MGPNHDGEYRGSQLCIVHRVCRAMHVGVCPRCIDDRPARFCAELCFRDGSYVVTTLDGLHQLDISAPLRSLAVYKFVPQQGYSRLLLENREISDINRSYKRSEKSVDGNDSELASGLNGIDGEDETDQKVRKVTNF